MTLAAAAVLIAPLATAGAQVVRAPRYQGNVEAPTPQLNLPALPPAITPHGVVVEDVVARVNDQIISRSDIERAEQQLTEEDEQQHIAAGEAAIRQRDMLRDMIDQQLLLSKAKEMGLNADADVVRQLDDIRKKNNIPSMEDLEKAVRQQGLNFEDFKAKIRDQVLTQQVVRDEVGRRLQATQAEEQSFYTEHQKEFDQPEQVKLSEILIPLPETADAAQIAAGEAKANEVKTQIMQGKDFADLAKKYSGGQTAAQGGDLGQYKRGVLAKVLEDQTFGLNAGESTQPIRTRQGWVILKVTQHDQAGPAPFKSVEPQVQEALYMQQMQPALRTYLTKLRDESYVDIQPGFVDSGASPNETKPVFTAYAPPAVKVKKQKDKSRFDRSGRVVPVSATSTANSTAGAAAAKPVIASPDTTGTRTLTGEEGKTNIDPTTGLAVLPPAPAKPSGKVGKVKREKVRYGQAPRDSLPTGTAVASTDTPVASAPAPGAALTSETGRAPGLGGLSAQNTDPNAPNPLTPVVAPAGKTRFNQKAVEVKQKKVAKVESKKQEKIAATPVAASSDETASAKTQAAPLGLNGDTTKKPAKPKKVKGAPKERLEEKPKTVAAAPARPAPTANPALAPTSDIGSGRPAAAGSPATTDVNPNATPAEKPKADTTTLPPSSVPIQPSATPGPPPGTVPPQL